MKIHNPQAEYLIHELNGERSTHGTRIRLNYYPVTLLGIKKKLKTPQIEKLMCVFKL